MFCKILFVLGKGGLSCCVLMHLGCSTPLCFMANNFRASRSDAGLPHVRLNLCRATPDTSDASLCIRSLLAKSVGCLNSGDTKSASICTSFCKPALEQRDMGIPSITQGWHPLCPQGKAPSPPRTGGCLFVPKTLPQGPGLSIFKTRLLLQLHIVTCKFFLLLCMLS